MRLDQKLEGIARHVGIPSRDEMPATNPSKRAAGGLGLEYLLDGYLHSVGTSACFVVETVKEATEHHGLHAFDDLRNVSGERLSLISKDPELRYADISRAVFLDTETTGLGMGAGTYVFLVGAGYFIAGEFRVKQFFLRGPGEEGAFLTALEEFLCQFSTIVTFNGKAFDWPLLESRFVRQRRELPLRDPAHVDLLHPARRLWKRRLESCALSSLERHILKVERTGDDVAGWEIPMRYFTYQRTGDGRQLLGVFYHNLQDILSLASLTIHVDRVMQDPSCGLVTDAVDFFCLGAAFDRAGEAERAIECYEDALRQGTLGPHRAECLVALAVVYKRERRWDAALQAWDLLVDDGGEHALYARVELAKFFEHVERDYLQALDQVQSALRLADLYESSWPEANHRDLYHRQARLLNRSMRQRAWSNAHG